LEASVVLEKYSGTHASYNLRLATDEERAKFLSSLEPNYQIF
jgi:hypothetical protein